MFLPKLVGGGQMEGGGERARAGLPAGLDLGRNAGIIPQRARRNDDLASAAGGVWQRGNTGAAERRPEAARSRRGEARHMILSGEPAEGRRQHIGVGRKRAAGRPAASRTMAFHEFREGQIDLEFYDSAKTAATYAHVVGLRRWRAIGSLMH